MSAFLFIMRSNLIFALGESHLLVVRIKKKIIYFIIVSFLRSLRKILRACLPDEIMRVSTRKENIFISKSKTDDKKKEKKIEKKKKII